MESTISVQEYTGLLSSELLSDEFASSVRALTDEILRCWKLNRRIFVAGNGGSAATAAHFVNDLRKFVPGGLSAFCLSDNVPYMTAIANDDDYEAVFRESLVLDGEDGDLFVAISTSGKSPNILSAIGSCNVIGMRVFFMTGNRGSFKNFNGILCWINHPDIRGKEDLFSILCHLAVGEAKRALENAGE